MYTICIVANNLLFVQNGIPVVGRVCINIWFGPVVTITGCAEKINEKITHHQTVVNMVKFFKISKSHFVMRSFTV